MLAKKPGFTLIELVIVLLILGLLAGVGIPALQNRLPGFKRNEFIARFNAMLNFAWQQALADQKTHQLLLDLNKHSIRIEAETEQKGRDGKPIFKPITATYFDTEYQWPDNIQFKQFFVDGTDMMRGIKAEEMWFYVVPDGLVQAVIINLIDTSDEDARGEPLQFSLVVNPFTAQVTAHDTFQKP